MECVSRWLRCSFAIGLQAERTPGRNLGDLDLSRGQGVRDPTPGAQGLWVCTEAGGVSDPCPLEPLGGHGCWAPGPVGSTGQMYMPPYLCRVSELGKVPQGHIWDCTLRGVELSHCCPGFLGWTWMLGPRDSCIHWTVVSVSMSPKIQCTWTQGAHVPLGRLYVGCQPQGQAAKGTKACVLGTSGRGSVCVCVCVRVCACVCVCGGGGASLHGLKNSRQYPSTEPTHNSAYSLID